MNEDLVTQDLCYERVYDLVEDLFALIWTMQPEDPEAYEHVKIRDFQREWNSLKQPLLEAFSVREALSLVIRVVTKQRGNENDS